jgi:DNA-binding response OmpR family regulator
VFSKDELLELVWGNDFEGTTNAVELYISYLRNKLDAKWDEKLIHTVRGAGYVLREGT